MDIKNVKSLDLKQMYETTFIYSPEASEEDYKNIVSKYEGIIKDNDGELINTERWGVKPLAYPIKKKNSGYYTYIEFKSPTAVVDKLEREYKYNEQLLRYLTIKLDKDAIEYNNKRRDGSFNKKDKETAKAK